MKKIFKELVSDVISDLILKGIMYIIVALFIVGGAMWAWNSYKLVAEKQAEVVIDVVQDEDALEELGAEVGDAVNKAEKSAKSFMEGFKEKRHELTQGDTIKN